MVISLKPRRKNDTKCHSFFDDLNGAIVYNGIETSIARNESKYYQ